MRKKIFGGIAIAAIAAVVSLNINIITKKTDKESTFAFANKDILAYGELNEPYPSGTGIATTTVFECSKVTVDFEYTWGGKTTTTSGNVGAGVTVPYYALWNINTTLGGQSTTSGGSYGYTMTTTTAKWSATGVTCPGSQTSNCHPTNPCS